MTEPSSPYSAAPMPNTDVAMRALEIWKFMPNVPSMNTMTSSTMMSGRELT